MDKIKYSKTLTLDILPQEHYIDSRQNRLGQERRGQFPEALGFLSPCYLLVYITDRKHGDVKAVNQSDQARWPHLVTWRAEQRRGEERRGGVEREIEL